MSVLVKGMEMPENCLNCDINTSYNYCPILRRDTSDIRYDKRFDDCPIVEVKAPHGELVDVSEVKKCLHDLLDSEDKWGAIALLEWAMEKRIVIEAEGIEEIQGCNDDGCPIFFGDSSDEPEEGAEE